MISARSSIDDILRTGKYQNNLEIGFRANREGNQPMRTVERKSLKLGGAHEAWIVYQTERYAEAQPGKRERIPRAPIPAMAGAVA